MFWTAAERSGGNNRQQSETKSKNDVTDTENQVNYQGIFFILDILFQYVYKFFMLMITER